MNKQTGKQASKQSKKQAILAQASKNGQTQTRNNILSFAYIYIYLNSIYSEHSNMFAYFLSSRTFQTNNQTSEQTSTHASENTQTQKTNASLAFVFVHVCLLSARTSQHTLNVLVVTCFSSFALLYSNWRWAQKPPGLKSFHFASWVHCLN